MLTQAKIQDESLPNGLGRILQLMAVAFLGVTALACIHALLWHLHYILAPFVLSGFLVFAVEPSVELIYTMLAGLAPPYRWCCCCMHRRWRRQRRPRDEDVEQSSSSSSSNSELSDERPEEAEERQEMQTLAGDDAGADWEGFWIRILDGLCRMAAVAAAILGLIFVAFFLISMLARGAYEVKENWRDYQVGMRRLLDIFDHVRDGLVKTLKLSGSLDERVKMIYTNAVDRVQELVLALVDSIAGFVTGGVSFAAMVVLYMLFWFPTITNWRQGERLGSQLHLEEDDRVCFVRLQRCNLVVLPEY
jgi:predicted PurR-regulated permease PerM